MTNTTLTVNGMHCASCGLLIDDTLEDLPGVTRSQTDSKNGRTVFTFDPGVTAMPEIVEAIRQLGYVVQEPTL